MREFKSNAKARGAFGREAGIEEHKRWEKEKARLEVAKGRVEKEISAPRRSCVIPTAEPFAWTMWTTAPIGSPIASPSENMRATKRWSTNTKNSANRHIEADEAATGRRVKGYDYSLYPSPKDIDKG